MAENAGNTFVVHNPHLRHFQITLEVAYFKLGLNENFKLGLNENMRVVRQIRLR
jgi:hypothetical protein